MIPDSVLRQVVWTIHSNHELAGCVIGYYGEHSCRTIAYPSCVTPNSENIAVIVEEVYLVRNASLNTTAPLPPDPKPIVTNRSRIGAELVGAGASCGLAAISAVGVFGGAAAELPTGGASTFLIIASWGGFVTGSIQCANGIVRVGAALAELDGNSLEEWDKNQKYAGFMLLVDAIGVATAVGSLPFAIRELWAIFARLRAFNALKLSFESLKAMNRSERLRTIARVFKEASRTGEGTEALVVAAKRAQIGAKTLQGAREGLSVRHATTLRKIIHDETVKRLRYQLLDVFGNAAGLIVSGTPERLTGSGSGSVNWVIHLLDAGEPNFE